MSVEAELTLEISKFRQGLSSATASVRSSTSEMKRHADEVKERFDKIFEFSGAKEAIMGAIGGGTLLGIVEKLHGIAEGYAKIYDYSRRFGNGTDEMQKLNAMATLGGESTEGLVTSVQKLQRALENVGDEKVGKAMQELRLGAQDLAGESPDRQIQMVAEAFKKAQEEGRGFDAVFELMGRSAGEMIPIFRDYEEIVAKADLTPTINAEDVHHWKELADSISVVTSQLKGYIARVAMHPVDMLFGRAQEGDLLTERRAQYEKERKENPDSSMLPENKSGEERDNVDWKLVDERIAEEEKQDKGKAAAGKRADAEANKGAAQPTREQLALEKQLEQVRAATTEAGLDDTRKLAAAQERLEELKKQEWAAMEAGPVPEAERLKLLIEQEKVRASILDLEKKVADEQRRGHDEAEKLGHQAEMGRIDTLKPAEQMRALRNELGRELGLDKIISADQIGDALKKLRAKAKQEGEQGDFEGMRRDYAMAGDAESTMKKMTSLDVGPRPMGALGGQINALLGKSHSEMIHDEAKKHTGLLQQMVGILQNLGSGTGSRSPWIPDSDHFTN